MPSMSEIKSRMQSISETKKVTDAMYMISSVKMGKARREHQYSERYFNELEKQIGTLIQYTRNSKSRYFHKGLAEGHAHYRHGILLITSDKGLCGEYNQTAIKLAKSYMKCHPETMLFIVGEYGRAHFEAQKMPYIKDFKYPATLPSVTQAQKICIDLLDYYDNGLVDEINIIYTDYLGAKPSECKRQVVLPLDKSSFYKHYEGDKPYKEFFPDAATVLDGIIPSYLVGVIYSGLVDSYCSEQQTRMLSMKTASTNAEEIYRKLKGQYNSIRQAKITNEMIEITSGAGALNISKKREETENG